MSLHQGWSFPWILCPCIQLCLKTQSHVSDISAVNLIVQVFTFVFTEPYLGQLYRSYIIVQILNCKILERVLLKGAIWKRFSKVSQQWRCPACHLLQVFTRLGAIGIEKYRALEYYPLILKLQVTFTKRLSFKTTFKGHSIIKYLNHASTKDVINTQNQSQIWIYLNTTCCVQPNIVLWDRVNLNCTGILKADTLRLQQLWKKLLPFWVDISHKRATSSI